MADAVNAPQEPAPIVAEAIKALDVFGVKNERTAGMLLPLWHRYLVMTAADRAAVYRHYRTGNRGGA